MARRFVPIVVLACLAVPAAAPAAASASPRGQAGAGGGVPDHHEVSNGGRQGQGGGEPPGRGSGPQGGGEPPDRGRGPQGGGEPPDLGGPPSSGEPPQEGGGSPSSGGQAHNRGGSPGGRDGSAGQGRGGGGAGESSQQAGAGHGRVQSPGSSSGRHADSSGNGSSHRGHTGKGASGPEPSGPVSGTKAQAPAVGAQSASTSDWSASQAGGSTSPTVAAQTAPLAASPSQGAAAPAVGVAAPVASRQSAQAAGRVAASGGRAGRAEARKASSRGPGASALATSPGVAGLVSGVSNGGVSAGGAGGRGAHRAAASANAASASSPIVTTITRIVGVVPTAVWLLVGVLCALALAFALRGALVAMRARRLERQRGELLEDVGLLQAALLPIAPARLGPVGTSAAYRPAEGPGAGGDFYDVFALADGQVGVVLGDVSGHGRQALPHTALVRFTLRAYLEAGLSPREALSTAGTVLERQLGGSFVTVVVATYQPRERILTYATAGHPPPVVLGPEPLPTVVVCSAPPIGAGMRTGTRQTVVSVPGGSRVCFYTDGLTEARVGRDLYGAERLTRALSDLGPGPTASEVLARVVDETTTRPDDMAVCLLNVTGGSEQSTVLVEEIELDRTEVTGERVERFLIACGVQHGELAALTASAQAVAGKEGTVLMQLRPAEGSPEVTLVRDNVALLHGAQGRRAGVGGLR